MNDGWWVMGDGWATHICFVKKSKGRTKAAESIVGVLRFSFSSVAISFRGQHAFSSFESAAISARWRTVCNCQILFVVLRHVSLTAKTPLASFLPQILPPLLHQFFMVIVVA
jgi:hypothetical protein